MKKIEHVYLEILHNAMEKKVSSLTQSYLSKELGLSLSTVNLALDPLRRMNAVEVKQRGLIIKDPKKILYYWASIRNLDKDIIYRTRAGKPIKKIESEMPSSVIYTSFTAYKFKFEDVPADYSEVYVYAETDEIMKRFPPNTNTPNVFVLKKDKVMSKYGATVTSANLFVDLWNQREWYAKDFLKALEVRLHGILE
ncbi:MAG: helix-turn-helix domain-containing protein [Nanoarchaeota archaeon]|nr:helix-turn-helix domain-containing protein [Nanoarchaeota archaeon]